jgi:hypothetical protein
MGILGRVWYAGAPSGVAVLYSVVSGAVREFWVKTSDYDRNVGDDSEFDSQILPVTMGLSIQGNDTGGSFSGTVTVNFSAPSGTTITPSSMSFSASVSAGTDNTDFTETFRSVRVVGTGAVTADIAVSGTTTGASAVGGIGATIGLGLLYDPTHGGEYVTTIPVGFSSSSGSVVTSNYISFIDAYLNGNYALIRNSGLSGSTQELTSISFAAASISGDSFSSAYNSSMDGVVPGQYLFFRVGLPARNYKLYRVTSNDGVNLTAALVSESGSASIFVSSAVVFSAISPEILYGLHTIDDDLTRYAATAPPVNLDDWRRELVPLTPPDFSLLGACLVDYIYDPQAILDGGNLYTIDLDQIISGQTLRNRLQTSAATVTATLTTQTATSGDTCTLGTAAESTVQVPSPGRGTIEGITYLP